MNTNTAGSADWSHTKITAEKGEELATQILKDANNLGISLKEYWGPITQKIEELWTGDDEYRYEVELAKRFNQLWGNAYGECLCAAKQIENCVNYWIETENNNVMTIDGASLGKGNVPLENWGISARLDEDFAPIHLVDPNTKNQGVKNIDVDSGAATKIEQAIKDLETSITSDLVTFSDGWVSKVNEAFVGHVEPVTNYLLAIKEQVKATLISYQDFISTGKRMITEHYSAAAGEFNREMNSSKEEIDKWVVDNTKNNTTN